MSEEDGAGGSVHTEELAHCQRPFWGQWVTDRGWGHQGSSSGGHLPGDPPSGLWCPRRPGGHAWTSAAHVLGRGGAPTWAPGHSGPGWRAGSTLRNVPLTRPRLPAWGSSPRVPPQSWLALGPVRPPFAGRGNHRSRLRQPGPLWPGPEDGEGALAIYTYGEKQRAHRAW